MKRRKKDFNRSTSHRSQTSEQEQFRSFWRLDQYRFLGVVLALTLPLGIYEAMRDDLPRSNAEVRPEWLLNARHDLARTLVELYPDRSLGHLFRAYQAGMCWENGFQPEVCRQFPHRDLRDVRLELEKALSTGNADHEQIFHFYAFLQIQLREPQEEVDRMIRVWRTHYPHSQKPDPRELPGVSRNSGGQ